MALEIESGSEIGLTHFMSGFLFLFMFALDVFDFLQGFAINFWALDNLHPALVH